MSPSALPPLPDAATTRIERSRALALALGPPFGADDHAAASSDLACVRHLPTGLPFVAVPGGSFEMGLSGSELTAIAQLGAGAAADIYRLQTDAAQPPRRVDVRSFLCARVPLLEPLEPRWMSRDRAVLRPEFSGTGDPVPAHLTAVETARVASAHGMRLLSEAEWEYVARDGGTRSWIGAPLTSSDADLAETARALAEHPHWHDGGPLGDRGPSFGVWGMLFGEWVADGWHATYEGAPTNAHAWDPGAEPCVARGGGATLWPWRDDRGWLLCHAAVRHVARRTDTVWGVRLALDLPR